MCAHVYLTPSRPERTEGAHFREGGGGVWGGAGNQLPSFMILRLGTSLMDFNAAPAILTLFQVRRFS